MTVAIIDWNLHPDFAKSRNLDIGDDIMYGLQWELAVRQCTLAKELGLEQLAIQDQYLCSKTKEPNAEGDGFITTYHLQIPVSTWHEYIRRLDKVVTEVVAKYERRHLIPSNKNTKGFEVGTGAGADKVTGMTPNGFYKPQDDKKYLGGIVTTDKFAGDGSIEYENYD